MFLGLSYLAVHVHARAERDGVGRLPDRARRLPAGLGRRLHVLRVQATTLLILILAANTSFQGFPRLSALLARDRFAPRQFSNLGDRLVFSNGMLVLAGAAAALLVIYKANTNSLIHLYVIGVFTAFTISQVGMVRYWQRTRTSGWRGRALVNGVGASATGLVTVIVVWTKFAEGAWLVTVAIPVLVLVMLGVRRHYAPSRAASQRRSCGRRGGPRCPQPYAARRRGSRPGGRAGARLRPRDRAGRIPRDPRSPPRQRSRDRPALVPPLRRGSAPRDAGPARADPSTPCSSRSGGCHAANPTSSPSSSPSSSVAGRSARRHGTRSSSP